MHLPRLLFGEMYASSVATGTGLGPAENLGFPSAKDVLFIVT